jgi:hypothetical protein
LLKALAPQHRHQRDYTCNETKNGLCGLVYNPDQRVEPRLADKTLAQVDRIASDYFPLIHQA